MTVRRLTHNMVNTLAHAGHRRTYGLRLKTIIKRQPFVVIKESIFNGHIFSIKRSMSSFKAISLIRWIKEKIEGSQFTHLKLISLADICSYFPSNPALVVRVNF